jgi:hypothetical protein
VITTPRYGGRTPFSPIAISEHTNLRAVYASTTAKTSRLARISRIRPFGSCRLVEIAGELFVNSLAEGLLDEPTSIAA